MDIKINEPKNNFLLGLEEIDRFCASNDIFRDVPMDVTAYSCRICFRHLISGVPCDVLVDKLEVESQDNYEDFAFSVIKYLRQRFKLPYVDGDTTIKHDLHVTADIDFTLTPKVNSKLFWKDIKSGINDNSYNFAFNIEGDSAIIFRPDIIDVKFNGPATIVFWDDGVKTIVRCNDEDFDKEKGLAMAIAKRFLGSNKSKSNYCEIFKKFIPELED